MHEVLVFYNCPEEMMDFAVITLQEEALGDPVAVMTAEYNSDWRLLEFYHTTNAFDSHVYIVSPCVSVPDYVHAFAVVTDVAPLQQNGMDVNM